MLEKTKGVVFNYIKFKETSIIVRIYTERFGLQSYMINGVRAKKSKVGLGLFQPLTLLDLVVFHRDNKNIKRISEVKCYSPFQTIPFDFKKLTVSLFISEILGKCIREESEDQDLFTFLLSTIEYFDTSDYNADFHLWFLVKFSYFLGFGPSEVNDIVSANSSVSQIFSTLLSQERPGLVCSSNLERRRALDLLIKYYSSHQENFGEVKSLKVLSEVVEK